MPKYQQTITVECDQRGDTFNPGEEVCVGVRVVTAGDVIIVRNRHEFTLVFEISDPPGGGDTFDSLELDRSLRRNNLALLASFFPAGADRNLQLTQVTRRTL